jgi:hypothetical protein
MDIGFSMSYKKPNKVFIVMKTCSICSIEKPLDDYNNQKLGKFGKRSYCRVCQSEMKKKYNQTNRNHITEYQRQYRLLNPEYNKNYQKNRRETDINYRLIGNMRARICNIIKGKTSNTLDCLGLDVEQFKKYLQSKFVIGMSWENYGEWEVDHKIPVSIANNETEICKLNHYTNLQPLWKMENKQKSNKVII